MPYSLKHRGRTIELEVGDILVDNGSCLQLRPLNNASKKIPRYSTWDHQPTQQVIGNKAERVLRFYLKYGFIWAEQLPIVGQFSEGVIAYKITGWVE